jgi:hypothetical protein
LFCAGPKPRERRLKIERERERELNLREIGREIERVEMCDQRRGWVPYIVKWTAQITPK